MTKSHSVINRPIKCLTYSKVNSHIPGKSASSAIQVIQHSHRIVPARSKDAVTITTQGETTRNTHHFNGTSSAASHNSSLASTLTRVKLLQLFIHQKGSSLLWGASTTQGKQYNLQLISAKASIEPYYRHDIVHMQAPGLTFLHSCCTLPPHQPQ